MIIGEKLLSETSAEVNMIEKNDRPSLPHAANWIGPVDAVWQLLQMSLRSAAGYATSRGKSAPCHISQDDEASSAASDAFSFKCEYFLGGRSASQLRDQVLLVRRK